MYCQKVLLLIFRIPFMQSNIFMEVGERTSTIFQESELQDKICNGNWTQKKQRTRQKLCIVQATTWQHKLTMSHIHWSVYLTHGTVVSNFVLLDNINVSCNFCIFAYYMVLYSLFCKHCSLIFLSVGKMCLTLCVVLDPLQTVSTVILD